ncbi:MAG: twin-arginine translocation signal domain-containing protein [Deltaproteobacteria bacterium]|nr:twin-arginine translocation signal domain-containing protein [Deltaproteobacteria bacterium]
MIQRSSGRVPSLLTGKEIGHMETEGISRREFIYAAGTLTAGAVIGAARSGPARPRGNTGAELL